MSNEVRQAWQRFYAAALQGITTMPEHSAQTAHDFAVVAADLGAEHYAKLIPVKQPRAPKQ